MARVSYFCFFLKTLDLWQRITKDYQDDKRSLLNFKTKLFILFFRNQLYDFLSVCMSIMLRWRFYFCMIQYFSNSILSTILWFLNYYITYLVSPFILLNDYIGWYFATYWYCNSCLNVYWFCHSIGLQTGVEI